MKIQDIIQFLERTASLSLQEDYDNSGLITGNPAAECTGMMVSLDATPAVIAEAISKNCNVIICHHPILFRGLKKINGKNYVEQAIIMAIKADVAIYAIHTNLDNVLKGVNGKIAEKLGLEQPKLLLPKPGLLEKLVVYVPSSHEEIVRKAVFEAGAGKLGEYEHCSFRALGTGTFTAGQHAKPFVGEKGQLHEEPECRLEVLLPAWQRSNVLKAMSLAHPYEEVAYDIFALLNPSKDIGAGLLAQLPEPISEIAFLEKINTIFGIPCIRHTNLNGRMIRQVALCGGAGSFLIQAALAAGADAFLTADLKYHEFFDAEGEMLLADIGHFESEQFTVDLLDELLRQNFPNFAVLKTRVNTNPVHYFVAK